MRSLGWVCASAGGGSANLAAGAEAAGRSATAGTGSIVARGATLPVTYCAAASTGFSTGCTCTFIVRTSATLGSMAAMRGVAGLLLRASNQPLIQSTVGTTIM